MLVPGEVTGLDSEKAHGVALEEENPRAVRSQTGVVAAKASRKGKEKEEDAATRGGEERAVVGGLDDDGKPWEVRKTTRETCASTSSP